MWCVQVQTLTMGCALIHRDTAHARAGACRAQACLVVHVAMQRQSQGSSPSHTPTKERKDSNQVGLWLVGNVDPTMAP